MVKREKERRRYYDLPSHLIVPVALARHPDGLPAQITKSGIYVDFSHFTITTPELKSNMDFLPDIGKIVERIVQHYHILIKCTPSRHDCN